jgi:pyruvate ferredoxin oxidoreductase gamma subunit
MRMFITRVLGRNDREVLATAELLAVAAAAEGRLAAFVSTASPGAALCMIDARAPAAKGLAPTADALIVQDSGEISGAEVFARLSPEAYVLVNSACGFGDLGVSERVERFCRDRTLILPVTSLKPGADDPVVRSSMIGGFAALCRVISLRSVISAIRDTMPEHRARVCAQAAAAAYEFVQAEREALAA